MIQAHHCKVQVQGKKFLLYKFNLFPIIYSTEFHTVLFHTGASRIYKKWEILSPSESRNLTKISTKIFPHGCLRISYMHKLIVLNVTCIVDKIIYSVAANYAAPFYILRLELTSNILPSALITLNVWTKNIPALGLLSFRQKCFQDFAISAIIWCEYSQL